MNEQEFRRPQIILTRNLRIPNEYTLGLDGEYRHLAFNEERAPANQGQWRKEIFGVDEDFPMDLEIGTGNGTFFHHYCHTHPQRNVVGVELKYKPLIQTIRRNHKLNLSNGRVVRTHAFNLDLVFAAGEINDIYIHFPDPWVTPRKPKNRIFNPRMLKLFWNFQRLGSRIHFKTDSREMFDWSLDQIQKSSYKIEFQTRDLHREPGSEKLFRTQFENIFVGQGLPIYALRMQKCPPSE